MNLLLKFVGDINSITNNGHCVLNFFFRDHEAYGILKNHVRKLRAAGLFLSRENYFLADDENDEEMNDESYVSLDDCHDELNAMKNYFIVGNISYHDFVTKRIDRLAVYARNKVILKSFNSHEYMNIFPVYSDLIRSNFMMGIRRNNLLKEGTRCLYSVNSDFSRLEDEICTEMILTYLSDIELQSVILACKPCNDSA